MKSLINSEIFRSRPLPITTPSSFLYPTLNYVQKWSIVHLYPADLTFAYRTKLGGSTNRCTFVITPEGGITAAKPMT